MIVVRIRANTRKFRRDFERFREKLIEEIDIATVVTARGIEEEMRASFRRPKHGRWVISPKTRRPHRRSAPGQPPAKETGTLDRSLRIDGGKKKDGAEYLVKVGAPYGFDLEFMMNRQFAGPALDAKTRSYYTRLRGAVHRAGYAFR